MRSILILRHSREGRNPCVTVAQRAQILMLRRDDELDSRLRGNDGIFGMTVHA